MAEQVPKVDDATLRRMCHLVTHDLRNPLAAIVTNLEFAKRLLEEEDADPDLAEAVRDSVTACDVLRRIVSNFDLLAKQTAESGGRQGMALDQVVQEVARRCEARAEQAELTLAVTAEGPVKVRSDRTMLALAVENLLANAIQHSPSRGRVDVAVRAADGTATVEVRDGGTVLEGEMAEIALSVEAHTMEGRQPNSRYGRGLGLLSAQLAAYAAGATVRVASDGQNVFVLSMPLDD